MFTKSASDESVSSDPGDESRLEEFWLEIDPSLAFEERLNRGNYNHVHPDITPANFKLRLTRRVRRKIVLHDPKGYVTLADMTRRFKAEGDACATFDDLLEFGYRFPDRQRVNPIVFLLDDEDYWHNPGEYLVRRVPYLHVYRGGGRWPAKRGLFLDWFEGTWGDYCRFAALRTETVIGP